jgi:hypothetical protein
MPLNSLGICSYPSLLKSNFVALSNVPVVSRSILTSSKLLLSIYLMSFQIFVVCNEVHGEILSKMLGFVFWTVVY